MDMVTNHMSHDKNVHKNFYRMDDSTVELAIISKLLHHSSKGELHKFKGHDLVSLPYALSEDDDDGDDVGDGDGEDNDEDEEDDERDHVETEGRKKTIRKKR
jgi:hypothetical protein